MFWLKQFLRSSHPKRRQQTMVSSEEGINNLLSNKDFCKMIDDWIVNLGHNCKHSKLSDVQICTLESFILFYQMMNTTPSLNLSPRELFECIERRWDHVYC